MKNIAPIACCAFAVLFFAAIAYAVVWYNVRQSDVYRSQGVDISPIEVFFGIRPAGTPASVK